MEGNASESEQQDSEQPVVQSDNHEQIQIVNSAGEVFYNTIEISSEHLSRQIEVDGSKAENGSHFKFQIIGAEGTLENYKLVDLDQMQSLNEREVIIINADNLQIESTLPSSSAGLVSASAPSTNNNNKELSGKSEPSDGQRQKKKEVAAIKPKFILPNQVQQQQVATQPNFVFTSVDGKTFQLAPAQDIVRAPNIATFPSVNVATSLQPQMSFQYLLPQNVNVLPNNVPLEILGMPSVIQPMSSNVDSSSASTVVEIVNDNRSEKGIVVSSDNRGLDSAEVQVSAESHSAPTTDRGDNSKEDGNAVVKSEASLNTVSYVMAADTQNISNANTINVSVPGMPGVVCQLQRYLYTQGLCRVCLLVKNDLVSIFEDVNITSNGLIENARGPHAANKYNIIPAIKTLLDVEVNFGDGLPEQICVECIDNLTSFSVFRKRISIGQSKLQEILAQVQGSSNPTVIPELGEVDMKKTDVFRHAENIIQAKYILKTSTYSHLVVRNISDRVWEKIFQSLSVMVGYKSGKLKSLEGYAIDQPYATGWFCYPCNTTFHGPKESFAHHSVSVHGVKSVEDVLFPCDVCAHSFSLQDSSGISQNYGEHWLQHFFFFECTDCNKRMPSQKGLWVHRRSAHNAGEKVFQCTDCEKSFFKKAHLDAHKKTHMDPEERKRHLNWCKLCGKGLTSSLAAHVASVHSNDRPWKCEICNKQFKRKEILNGHRESVHFNMKKYQCELCGEFLKSHSTKALHILRHKGEKPHACEICDKRFYSSHSMKSHMLKHQNVGKVTCTICGKIFKRKMYLVEHMRLHTGEKPHECHICGKQIRMKSNFFKHLKVHKRREAERLAKEVSILS